MNTLNPSNYHIKPQNPHPFSVDDYRGVLESIQVYCETHIDPQIGRVKRMILECKNKGMI